MAQVEFTQELQQRYLGIAKLAAARASRDEQVVEEAAGHAVLQLDRYWDQVSTGELERKKWVEVVATNHARRIGARLHRELPMGRGGSEPPPMHDEQADEDVARLIAGIHLDRGSLGSMVATKVAFEERWALMSGEARSLLHMRYVEQMTLRKIAETRALGESTGAIDHKLKKALENARIVFSNLVDELRGIWHYDE